MNMDGSKGWNLMPAPGAAAPAPAEAPTEAKEK
jgi:hypothetical protein